MVLNIGEVLFQLGADTKGLQRATRDIKRFGAVTQRQSAVASRSLEDFGKTGTRAFRTLRRALVAYLSIGLVKNVLRTADSYAILQRRLRTATKATGDYVAVSKELNEISQRTGSYLATNVSLFQTVARAASALGATTDDVLRFTEVINQLGTIGGSNAEDLSRGVRQLGQALAGGVLRAEEFNSIIENTPEIAARIERGLGLATGQLRGAVNEGNVLAKDIFRVLLKQADAIGKEFAAAPLSLSQSLVILQNSFARFIGNTDEANGLVDALAGGLRALAGWIDTIDIRTFADNFVFLGEVLSVLWSSFRVGFVVVTEILQELRYQFRSWANAIQTTFLQVQSYALAFKDFFSFIFEEVSAAEGQALNDRIKANKDFADSLKTGRAEQITANKEEISGIVSVTAGIGEQTQQRIIFLNAETIARVEAANIQAGITAKLLADAELLAEFEEKERKRRINAFVEHGKVALSFAGDQIKLGRLIVAASGKSAREQFEINKALSIASAIISGGEAALGAFAAGIKYGPIVAAAFVASAAAITGAQIAVIAQTEYKGGRQLGGDVYPGGVYRVSETGPEMLSSGGSNYLMMGNKGGRVSPMSSGLTGGGGVNVNVYTLPGETANVSSRSSGDNTQLDIIIEAVDSIIGRGIDEGGTRTADALERNYGLSR